MVQPAAVEAAILAYREEAKKQDEVRGALERDLEAARYAASRAQRQYDATDPENRLVADELERRWNQALERVREIEQHIAQRAATLSKEPVPTLEEFSGLAARLEALWQRPDTDARLKKRIVRAPEEQGVLDLSMT